VGFAVPIDAINRLVPQIIRTGRAQKAGLGIEPAEDAIARRLGVEEGVLILSLTSGSVADKAGLRPTLANARGAIRLGDVIVAIDDRPVERLRDLYRILDAHEVGDTVEIRVRRRGEGEFSRRITLQDLS
jgi:S1-C subfamily serine protease